MRVLALDTSTSRLSVAVCGDGEPYCEISLEVKAGHAGILLGIIDEALAKAGTPRDGLDLVAVGLGPGSFTGLRIGIATARGLSDGLGLPIAGVPTMDAMASGVMPCPMQVATVIDARKGEVFCSVYDTSGRAVHGPVNILPESIFKLISGDTLFVGNACAVYRVAFMDALGGKYHEAPRHLWHPRASVIAALACGSEKRTPGGGVLPIYVRESDAQLTLRRRTSHGAYPAPGGGKG